MISDEFNCLDYHAKTEAILKGMFLADRLNFHYYVRLYNLDRFYVEVYFDDHNHMITHFHAFDHPHFVLPYLEDLKIAV